MTPQKPQDTQRNEAWQERHEAILEAVSRVLANEGDPGFTMQRIAAEAGVSVGYLYKHFPGKGELLSEILDRQMEAFLEEATGITAETAGSPLAALRERARTMTRQLIEQRNLLPMLLSVAEAYPEKIKKREKPVHRQNEELFRQAMAAGEIRPDNPGLLECAFSGMIWGMTMRWSRTNQLEKLETLPQLVDDLLLCPLEIRKDDTRDGKI